MGAIGSTVQQAEVAAAMRGDTEALRLLWQHHRRWVAAILLAHKPRDVDIEDLLQDVAMTMVTRIRELRDPSSFRPWLRMVAVNAARAQGRGSRRRRQRSAGFEAAQEAVAAPDPTGAVREREEAQRLLTLTARLPDGYREPLLLRCVQGMSYREIGKVLDLPETTVETRIARGRRMLRGLLNQEQPSAVEVQS